MLASRKSIQDEPALVRYLLGCLPEQEAERLDEQSIVDDETATRLRLAEDDLVDAYVVGALGGELLERFESFYLASPRRREKVAFATRLLAAVDRQQASPAAARRIPVIAAEPVAPVTPAGETRRRTASRVWFAGSLAAAALLALTCGIVLFQNAQLRRGLSEAIRQSVTADQRARALSNQLDEQRSANTSMTHELARSQASRPIAAVALVLRPQTRGADAVPLIAVRADSSAVPLELLIESVDYARYAVTLRDPATNRTLWRSAELTPSSSRLSVVVPARLLKTQHYSLELSGRRASGPAQIVGSYAFQVVPQ
jgi:hypothetical protein